MKILDFSGAASGTLVKRSAHQRAQLCIPADAEDVFGIMVGKEFYDSEFGVICYPVVHWEGQASESVCHPINVEPVRAHELPLISLC